MMKKRKLLLGDEALALGMLDHGLSGAYGYPGTPSTEIMEFIQYTPQGREGRVHCHWSCNEKTALESALGMSYCGKRAVVTMKHVGLNVAADPFVNSAMTGANGGFIIVSADDPSMHSSQNEQDSRFYGRFAMIPVLEPANQQEAYDMGKYAFELSEKHSIPVLVRMVTRLSHSRADVEVDISKRVENKFSYPTNTRQWVLMPANSRERNKELVKLYDEVLAQVSKSSPYNKIWSVSADKESHEIGIIASGIAFNYLREIYPDSFPCPVYKIGQYPLPQETIVDFIRNAKNVLILEEGQPYIESQVRGMLPSEAKVYGRLSGEVSRTGELNVEKVLDALYKTGRLGVAQPVENTPVPEFVCKRPPSLCQGCGHRDVFKALNHVLDGYQTPKVFGDIGCYTLGYLSPYNAIDSVVDMGASITMAKGAAEAGQYPSVAIIGDSTFTHSGMTGLLDAVNENSDITVIISDNLTTGMTGGQDSQGTGKIEQICLGLGVDPNHLMTLESLPNNHDEMCEIINKEIAHHGLSVIVSRRECIQTARRKVSKTSKTTK